MSETSAESPPPAGNQLATSEATAPNSVEPQNNGAAPAPRPANRWESFFSLTKTLIVRALIIYAIQAFFRAPKAPTTSNTSELGGTGPTQSIQASNIFTDGTPLTLYIYLSESEELNDYSHTNIFWIKENIIYGDWTSGPNNDGIYEVEKDVPITLGMQNNGSLYLHAFLTRLGKSPDPTSKGYDADQTCYAVKQLNRFKKLTASKTKNLLTGETDQVPVEDGKIISHWHSNFTLNLVTDQTKWAFGSVPAPFDKYLKFSEDFNYYKPILYPNDYWNMARDYKPLNETFSLRLTFQPLSLFKWQLYAAQAMRNSMFSMFDTGETQHTDEEQDTIKETLMDTNPYLLGLTIAVSLLHSVFELLAFKNDIQFWNNRNSLEGLSVRSVFFGVFQSLVVLLYVLDNETNFMVRVSCFVGLGIELWKIWKVVDIKVENGKLVFKDKGSYAESTTRAYDQLAFKYLSWVCFPLLAGYCGYALLYLEHKGWYSFVLDILYGYLLTFGFIMMTPQLFINYKLKSIAHLPWRMLTYKFLNTFIDDMFAFVIKMPTMYRLGCFRDDIVFLIFLYQRWIYPVDRKRRNEFGYSAEPTEEQQAVEEKKDQ